jgi:hypothetical protein
MSTLTSTHANTGAHWMVRRARRYLYLFHRWAGISLCLFFALWFLSGIFMMYVEFPQLTRVERLAGTAPLDFASIRLSPADAVAKVSATDFRVRGTPSRNEPVTEDIDLDSPEAFRSVILGSHLGRPAYSLYPDNGAQPRVVFADTGDVLRAVDSSHALAVAADFAVRAGLIHRESVSQLEHRGLVQTDQWSVSSGLNAHRPLHVIAIGDDSESVLYVSTTTGQVVRDTHGTERLLNYFGAVTHWIYPTVLRRYPDAWEWVVDILSGVGVVMAIAGMWIGVLRWRFRRREGQPRIPYKGLMRWHYISGALFGLVAITWVFSGLMSMNPGSINPSRSPTDAQREIFAGAPLSVRDYVLPASGTLPSDVREIELLQHLGRPLLEATRHTGEVILFSADAQGDVVEPSLQGLLQLAPQLMPGVAVAQQAVLTRYDDYYYTRHPERGEKRLPIIRIEFADDARTWFHINVHTGQVIERSTATNRLFRWLYNGLHSWDILWLWERRPLWDIAVISFSLGGLALSIIGVIAGVRRLRMS